MPEQLKEQNISLNRLWSKQDGIYHAYAARCGLSAAAFWVLYSLCETNEVYTQKAMAEMWCFPKQTVNSAIASLVKMGYVRLEQLAGARNSKTVKLTQQGVDIGEKLIQPLIDAELRALKNMTEQEREMFLRLTEKQYTLLQTEMDLLYASEKVDFRLEREEGDK